MLLLLLQNVLIKFLAHVLTGTKLVKDGSVSQRNVRSAHYH